MPTRKRRFLQGHVYHVYSRGVLRKEIFHDEKDYAYFIEKMQFYKQQLKINILAFCLMPNHFHLVLRDPGGGADPRGCRPGWSNLQKFMHRLLTSYGKYYASRYKNRSGYVFQGRYCSIRVDNFGYLLYLLFYVHHNPVKKGLVNRPEDWPFSSYEYLANDVSGGLVNKLERLNYAEIYEDCLNSKEQTRTLVGEVVRPRG